MSTVIVRETTKLSAVKASESFRSTWPYKAQYSTAPGFAMHYIDEGKGETLLFLHGEPTWGYLFPYGQTTQLTF